MEGERERTVRVKDIGRELRRENDGGKGRK